MARRVLHPTMDAFAKPTDFKFTREKVLSLMLSRAPELAIYLRRWTYLRASFHRSGVAPTRLVWTAVILNSSEPSGPHSNGRTPKKLSGLYI